MHLVTHLLPFCPAHPLRSLAAATLIATASLTGCSHGPRVGRSAAVSVAAALREDAAAGFAAAERLFRRGMFPEALAAYDKLRTEYPYSPEAPLSELREADMLFVQERYVEAAEAYKSFVRFHPLHAEAGYARAEAAESLLAQVPKEWWFLPPVAEKDQQILRQTIDAYDDLLAGTPTPRQTARAEAGRMACQSHLARHELYVARFYARRGAHKGALARAESLLSAPQPPQVAAEALALAAASAQSLGDQAAAGHFWQLLAKQYPHSREAKRAHRELEKTAG